MKRVQQAAASELAEMRSRRRGSALGVYRYLLLSTHLSLHSLISFINATTQRNH